jgi:hypothetical protein
LCWVFGGWLRVLGGRFGSLSLLRCSVICAQSNGVLNFFVLSLPENLQSNFRMKCTDCKLKTSFAILKQKILKISERTVCFFNHKGHKGFSQGSQMNDGRAL